MNIAFLMVLMKPCGSLPNMKLSNVMLCPVVWKCSKMGEGALKSLYICIFWYHISHQNFDTKTVKYGIIPQM